MKKLVLASLIGVASLLATSAAFADWGYYYVPQPPVAVPYYTPSWHFSPGYWELY